MIKLYNEDCLKTLSNLDENSIDLILADLPYGTTDRNGLENRSSKKNRLHEWDSVISLDELWKLYKKVLKKDGVVVLTSDQPFTSKLVLSNLEWFKYDWIWKKNKTVGFLHANHRPMKQTEDILVFSPLNASAASVKNGTNMKYNPQGLIPSNKKKKNSKDRLGIFLKNEDFMGKNNKLLGNTEYTQKYTNYPTEIIEFGHDYNKVHPTQKPVLLMEYLIKTYSNENELVLDNTMGSGTTGVAAVNTNRNFIGIEKDKEYFTIAKNRIEKAQNTIIKFT